MGRDSRLNFGRRVVAGGGALLLPSRDIVRPDVLCEMRIVITSRGCEVKGPPDADVMYAMLGRAFESILASRMKSLMGAATTSAPEPAETPAGESETEPTPTPEDVTSPEPPSGPLIVEP